jgi:hypothetical protein
MSAATEEVILCPLCDYDLRGQVEPRCPECGYHFNWDELRDPRRHPYLYEQHIERPGKSLRKTLTTSLLRPRRFWAELQPTHPPSQRRLLAYWLIVTLAALIPFVVPWVYLTKLLDSQNQVFRTRVVTWMTISDKAVLARQHGSFQRYLDVQRPVLPSWRVPMSVLPLREAQPLVLIALWILCWPWLTLLSLMIFRASMRKKQIKLAHVLRCVLYAADAMILTGLVIAAWIVLTFAAAPKPVYRLDPSDFTKLTMLAVTGVLGYRLWIAYRAYLRFDHALATVIASQIIVALAVFKFAIDCRMLWW